MNIYLVEYNTPQSQKSAVVHANTMKEAAIKFLDNIDEKEFWTISFRIESIREIK